MGAWSSIVNCGRGGTDIGDVDGYDGFEDAQRSGKSKHRRPLLKGPPSKSAPKTCASRRRRGSSEEHARTRTSSDAARSYGLNISLSSAVLGTSWTKPFLIPSAAPELSPNGTTRGATNNSKSKMNAPYVAGGASSGAATVTVATLGGGSAAAMGISHSYRKNPAIAAAIKRKEPGSPRTPSKAARDPEERSKSTGAAKFQQSTHHWHHVMPFDQYYIPPGSSDEVNETGDTTVIGRKGKVGASPSGISDSGEI